MDVVTAASVPATLLGAAPVARRRYDVLWLALAGLVGGLYAVGVLTAWRLGRSPFYSFSVQVSFVYLPLATLLMLVLGWSPRTYPLAAALFYAFLPLNLSASEWFFVAGDIDGGITLEMLLAIPLLAASLLGSRGVAPGLERATPFSLCVVWALLPVSALLSTFTALSPEVAAWTMLSRFVVPVAVTLAVYRRLRNIDEFKLVWFGYVLGTAIVAIYSIRRGVFDIQPWYVGQVEQRYAGATGSHAIPTLFVAGPALWYGHALAMRKLPLHGLPWLLLAAVIGFLIWLGGHRGPSVFFGLLVLLWIPRNIVRYLYHPKGLLIAALSAITIVATVTYFLTKTHQDVLLTWQRLSEMRTGGIRSEIRWLLWTEGIEYWSRNPLLGIGPNNWIVLDYFFESSHSSVVAILCDVGLLGAALFAWLFIQVVVMSRKRLVAHLPPVDLAFFTGCRTSWLVTLLLLAVNLPFTSGQPKHSIFAYVVFMFPLLAMLVRRSHPQPQYGPALTLPSLAALTPLPGGGVAYSTPACPATRSL